ncbi:MAG: DUF4065 domain-containing protein [Lachnospiraceae bacterium]|nr:DUF4065 domain-containing protein [Lachnospiraceae bacterium]
MNAKRLFCKNCGKDVDYIVEDAAMTGVFRDKECSYTGKAARCAQCGLVLDASELEAENRQELENAYRDEMDIITLEKLDEILEMYKIGKRPLSLAMGWGAQTVPRYFKGEVPLSEYSAILHGIHKDPELFLERLEKNKDRLSPTAYRKSRGAVDEQLAARGIVSHGYSKIDMAAKYIINKCMDITPLALQKALYYIQGFYHAFYGEFLFEEDCQAWAHGPVYKDIYRKYKDYRYGEITETDSDFDPSVFSTAETSIFDSVIDNLCCYSGKELERFTHKETPWITARGAMPANEVSGEIIDKRLIGEYFDAVRDKYDMVNPGLISRYGKDMFDGK